MIGKIKIAMLKGEKGDTGATGDYSGILNKPSINDVTLDGNKTASDLGLADAADQQNLIDTVNSLSAALNNAENDISDINGDIGNINDSITAINVDIATLVTKDAFIVTADYDPTNYAFSNADKTAAEIYAAVKTNGRPCYLFGNYNNTVFVARCVYSSSSVAWFTMNMFGISHTWVYTGGSFIHNDGKVIGSFTPESGISLLDGGVVRKGDYVSVNLLLDGTFQSGVTQLGVITGVDIPLTGIGVVAPVGTGTNLTKTGFVIIDSVGNVTVNTEVSTYTRVNISLVYQV